MRSNTGGGLFCIILSYFMMDFFKILILGILWTSCKPVCDEPDLKTTRQINNSNALRWNGLFYPKTITNSGGKVPYFFYQNGVVRVGCEDPKDTAATRFGCSANADFLNKTATNKPHWGVFLIDGNNIKIERWLFDNKTVCSLFLANFEGQILNDSTILLPTLPNGEHTVLDTLRFFKFSPKPDSVAEFIF
ncbi:MAG: hypothetical protein RL757_2129 [Bacteroidota bacterium]|jgi:hypothetical protein